MSNLMTYKGYTGKVGFDPEDQVFTGRVLGVKDIIGFHGETVAELVADFHQAVDYYLAVCAKRGETPDKPYSGKILLRVAPEVHAAAAMAAEAAGASLNQWVAETLRKATGA
jgi:predicted HicB family RNase H-like nuclease